MSSLLAANLFILMAQFRSGDAPIIFIHYGGAPFLSCALRHARRSNPAKRIFLLGDEENRSFAKGVAEFVPYKDLCKGRKSDDLLSRFRPIEGPDHQFNKLRGTRTWLRFVFLRWFCIEEHIRREGFERFWTFDSDTLLLADLSSRENRFRDFDATTQCRGRCLNGWVGSRQIVTNYTQCMIDLYGDNLFLGAQEKRVASQTGLAFNEMDAFEEFQRRSGANVWHAATPIDGEAFDDALAMTRGYEASAQKLLGRTTAKRLWRSRTGGLFAREQQGRLVRLLSCNMSWMPNFMWRRLSSECLPPDRDKLVRMTEERDLREISYGTPLLSRFLSGALALRSKAQKGLVGAKHDKSQL